MIAGLRSVRPALIAIAACAALLSVRAAVTQSLVAGDSVSYFLTARDLARGGGLAFSDGYRHFFETRSPWTNHRKILQLPEPDARTGRVPNPKPLGVGLMLAPFYAAAGGDDYGLRRQVFAAVGSLLWGFLGLALLLPIAGELATGAILFATPLVYYLTIEPLMGHACEFFASAALLRLWRRGDALATGMAGGLLTIIRYADIVYLLLPLIGFRREPRKVAAFLAGLLPAALLQAWENQALFGSPSSTFYGHQITFAPPSASSLLYHLFDPHAGFFLLTPLAVVAIYGSLRFGHRLLAGAFFAQWFLLAAVVPTDQEGAAFGNRLFIGALPFLAPGLGAALAHLRPSRARALVTILIAINLLLAALYCARILPDPYHGSS